MQVLLWTPDVLGPLVDRHEVADQPRRGAVGDLEVRPRHEVEARRELAGVERARRGVGRGQR